MIADTTIERFIKTQQIVYAQVIKELQNGQKTSHWMWFIFPQVDGLGFSATTKLYSIKSIEEAKEYVLHPLLGKRLTECCDIILQIKNKSAHAIFGSPDDVKLQSCMTLFSFVAPQINVFNEVLEHYFNDEKDEKTLSILQTMQNKH